MTIRSPLVLGADGLAQQLQSGDTISASVNTPSIRAVTNSESAAAIIRRLKLHRYSSFSSG